MVKGVHWWTFAADELEFLDTPERRPGEDQGREDLDELAAACDRWDRVIESDLATNDAEHDAALRIIEIARRVCSTRKAVNV